MQISNFAPSLIRCLLVLVSASLFIQGCQDKTDEGVQATPENVKIIYPSEIEFVPLNPARGDSAPQAGMLWGNLREDVSTGMILKFADGFSSPPHIHNITYRGMVISGALHNDDPKAEQMWMGPGSYWMQPAGEPHVTAAKPGAPAIAFLEILEGPYLVQPSNQSFDNGERPLNIDPSNYVWLGPKDLKWVERELSTDNSSIEVTSLWGKGADDDLRAFLVKVPERTAVKISAIDDKLDAVVIEGELDYQFASPSENETLMPASYFSSGPEIAHNLTCRSGAECMIYIRGQGSIRLY